MTSSSSNQPPIEAVLIKSLREGDIVLFSERADFNVRYWLTDTTPQYDVDVPHTGIVYFVPAVYDEQEDDWKPDGETTPIEFRWEADTVQRLKTPAAPIHHTTVELDDAEQFYYNNSAYSYRHGAGESQEHGRATTAILLAEAVRRVTRNPSRDLIFDWTPDQSPDRTDGYHGQMWNCVLLDAETWAILASTTGIEIPDDAPEATDAGRVVQAQLALEAVLSF